MEESRWAISLCGFVTCLADGGRFIHRSMISRLISCVRIRKGFMVGMSCM
jgi:hypothetical protein